jgi:hypothetical protein
MAAPGRCLQPPKSPAPPSPHLPVFSHLRSHTSQLACRRACRYHDGRYSVEVACPRPRAWWPWEDAARRRSHQDTRTRRRACRQTQAGGDGGHVLHCRHVPAAAGREIRCPPSRQSPRTCKPGTNPPPLVRHHSPSLSLPTLEQTNLA